jgi:hypothetical protein
VPEAGPPRRTPQPGRRSTLPVVVALVAGLAIGGAAGGLAGALGGTTSSATALVQVAATPDPGIAAVSGNAQSDTALADFATTEFAWLAGEELPNAVAGRLGVETEDVELTITRVGQSAVASFSGQATTPAAAEELVKAAVDVYIGRRKDSFHTDIENQLASVGRTIDGIGRPPGTDANRNTDPRLERLLALQSDLQLLANRDDPGVQVLQPAEQSRPGSPPWIIGVVLGAALGGLVALGALAVARAGRRTVAGTDDARAVTDEVLHPEVVLPRAWTSRTLPVLHERDQAVAELLVGQIAGRRAMTGRVIAVAGASNGSASRAVASLLAVALARRGPTVLVELAPPAVPHPLISQGADAPAEPRRFPIPTQVAGLEILTLRRRPRSATDPEWAPVLDLLTGGRRCAVFDVGTATEVMRLLPADCETVLTLGIGVDRRADAAALAAAVRGDGSPLLGVVTRQPWTARFGSRKPATEPATPAPATADV